MDQEVRFCSFNLQKMFIQYMTGNSDKDLFSICIYLISSPKWRRMMKNIFPGPNLGIRAQKFSIWENCESHGHSPEWQYGHIYHCVQVWMKHEWNTVFVHASYNNHHDSIINSIQILWLSYFLNCKTEERRRELANQCHVTFFYSVPGILDQSAS